MLDVFGDLADAWSGKLEITRLLCRQEDLIVEVQKDDRMSETKSHDNRSRDLMSAN